MPYYILDTVKETQKKKNKPQKPRYNFPETNSAKLQDIKSTQKCFDGRTYKINTEIFVAFLYTNKELSEKEFSKIPLAIA